MPPMNGLDRDAENTERLISLVARMNDYLRDSLGERLSFSERLERAESALDALREKEGERHTAVLLQLGELKSLLSRVREDTDPRGFRLLDPAAVEPRKADSGGALVAAARLAEKVPSSFWPAALKGLGAIGGGAFLHWLAQAFIHHP